MKRLLLGLAVLLAAATLAGNRARPGGSLAVAVVSPAETVDPLTADAPVDAFRLLLTHQLLCRVVELSRPSAGVLRLTPAAGLDPARVVEALQRVSTATGPAPALLSQVSDWTVQGRSVDLQLRGSGWDLERTLCHPAFAIPSGPFRAKGSKLEGVAEQPAGRPFLDTVTLQASDLRTAERLLAQRRVQLVVGSPGRGDESQLFVTALVLGPNPGALRAAIESTTDRADLARFFVPAPSGPLPTLLPGMNATVPTVARPAPLEPNRDLALLFDDSAEHERSIAQRLQVKLQPLGYRLSLHPTPRRTLRGHAPTEGELVLQSFALPPSATGALLVWIELAGQRARVGAVVQQLNAATDPEARARELATQLLAELPVIPLVTRGLGVTASRDVQHLTRDVLGLPRLDDVFLGADAP